MGHIIILCTNRKEIFPVEQGHMFKTLLFVRCTLISDKFVIFKFTF